TRGRGHPQTLRSANNLASVYLQIRPASAEPLLRETLTIREKKLPEDWSTFEAMSLLGGCLLVRKDFATAEPYLVRGYEGLQAHAAKIPSPYQKVRSDALDRIIRLYEDWGKNDRAEEWRKRREPHR